MNITIQDVSVKSLVRHHDDRGYFAEIAKFGEETFHAIKQTSYSESYPGVIKAFHVHKKQWDLWCVIKGSAQVVLYDRREDSPTKRQTNVLYIGEENPMLIAIPPGVAHGYRVLGERTLGLFYHTSEAYDPNHPDEDRVPFDSPDIGFDWETEHR